MLTAALLGSCSAVTTMFGPIGGFPAQRPLPVAGTELFDWKGMVHCHSYLSHDSKGTVAEIRAACDRARLDFLVMTDHQTDASIRDGLRGQLGSTCFLVGAEIRTPQGTVLAFPLQKPLRRWMSCGALIAEARQQGALVTVCHAESWSNWNIPGLAAAEIVNLHAGALTASPGWVIASALFLPVRFLLQRIAVADPAILAAWDRQLARHHPLPPLGGGDAHASIRVFGPLGGTIANYNEVFLTVSTHVLAPTCDQAAIVDAIQRGRTYVAFDIFHEGTGFDFRAEDPSGVHLPGATVTAAKGLRLSVHTPRAGDIQLVRDGTVVARADGDSLTLEAPPPGIYRVQVFTPFCHPWLFSSSIEVAAPAGKAAQWVPFATLTAYDAEAPVDLTGTLKNHCDPPAAMLRPIEADGAAWAEARS